MDRLRRLIPALLSISILRGLRALFSRSPHERNDVERGRPQPLTLEGAESSFLAGGDAPAEMLRALLDACPLAVVGLTTDGRVTLWSQAAQRLFGWREPQVIGRADPLAPGPLAGEASRLRDRALAGEPVNGVEAVRQTLDGGLVTVNVWAVPLRGPSLAPRVLFLYQDVSERKRTEQHILRQREALYRSEKLADLGRLAAGVAHELRNPLAVIGTRAELVQRQLARSGETAQALTAHIGYMEEAVARMKRIIAGLSSYARPSRAEPALLDMRDLLTAARELLRPDARKHGIEVVLDVPEQPAPVLGDQSRLMQILVNLGTNAVEAMAERGGRLVLRARLETAIGRVMIEVSDTGPGIPPDRLESIWEPFYTTKPEGTGLGLSIVRSLTEEQPGAALTLQSTPERGTTFRLSLVAAPEPAAEQRERSA